MVKKHDIDFNASKTILKQGLKIIVESYISIEIILSGTEDYRRGYEIRPTKVGTIDETFKKCSSC